jgi:hypothetical protein
VTQNEKKKLGPVAWVLIVSGGMVFAAVMVAAGLMTFGLFKAKEVAQEFQENPAKVVADWGVQTDDYLVFPASQAGDLPDWVPIYRKAENVEAIYTAQTHEGTSGTVKYETEVSAELLLGFYRRWLVEEQYQFQENDAVQGPDSAFFSLLGEQGESGRSVNMGFAEYAGRTKVTLNHMATPSSERR